MRRRLPPPNTTITAEELLAGYPPAVRRTAERLRVVVGRAVPTLVERTLPGWRAIAFRDPHAGHVCGIFPNEREVRLYVEHGARLPDPDGLLRSTPTMTRGRYVAFSSPRDIPARALARLLRAAVTLQSL